MRQIFKMFFGQEQTKPWLVLLCLVFGGFAEAIGIGTLLPLVSSVMNKSSGKTTLLDQYVGRAFDYISVAPTFNNMIILLAVVLILRSLLMFFALSYAGITSSRVSNYLRKNVIRAVLDARWSFYANQSGGRLAAALGNDASRAGDAYLTFATALACAIQIVAYAVVAFLINWRVAVAGLVGGILITAVTSKLVRLSKIAGFKQTDRIGTMTADTMDMLQNIKALKSMNRYGSLLAHLDVVLKRLKRNVNVSYLARYGLVYGNDAIVTLLVAGGAFAAYNYAGVALPELLVLGVLFFQVIAYASKLQKQVQTAVQFMGSYDRVTAILHQARGEKETLSGSGAPTMGAGLIMRDVHFSHGETKVLQGLSLNIPANAITVIQGPSGAGKTTLLDLLVGFHRPQSGQITLGKDDLKDIDLLKWRSMIGYVPQELALFHDTVTANITLYDEALTPESIAESLELSGVNRFLDVLPKGLDTDVGEFGGKLSGGQRQRISLARALVSSPKLLILDEVTSALDPETEDSIVNNIAQLRGKYTIIAITHRPAWTRIADQLYILKDGKAKSQPVSKRKAK
jgi:ATP-binding cassette, subfamily C, bacterial